MSEIEVPEDLRVLFELEKQKRTSSEDRVPLFEFLDKCYAEDPTFNAAKFLRENFNYTATDYNRLMIAYKRWKEAGRSLKKKPEVIIGEKETKDYADFLDKMWREARNISLDIVMGWIGKAKEMGYYNEEKQKVDMKKFIEDAVTFYIQYKYSIETLEERYRDLEALARTLARLLEPQTYRIIALKLYTEFVTEVMKLEARGIPVPEEFILDVRRMVTSFLRTTAPPELGGEKIE